MNTPIDYLDPDLPPGLCVLQMPVVQAAVEDYLRTSSKAAQSPVNRENGLPSPGRPAAIDRDVLPGNPAPGLRREQGHRPIQIRG